MPRVHLSSLASMPKVSTPKAASSSYAHRGVARWRLVEPLPESLVPARSLPFYAPLGTMGKAGPFCFPALRIVGAGEGEPMLVFVFGSGAVVPRTGRERHAVSHLLPVRRICSAHITHARTPGRMGTMRAQLLMPCPRVGLGPELASGGDWAAYEAPGLGQARHFRRSRPGVCLPSYFSGRIARGSAPQALCRSLGLAPQPERDGRL